MKYVGLPYDSESGYSQRRHVKEQPEADQTRTMDYGCSPSDGEALRTKPCVHEMVYSPILRTASLSVGAIVRYKVQFEQKCSFL